MAVEALQVCHPDFAELGFTNDVVELAQVMNEFEQMWEHLWVGNLGASEPGCPPHVAH